MPLKKLYQVRTKYEVVTEKYKVKLRGAEGAMRRRDLHTQCAASLSVYVPNSHSRRVFEDRRIANVAMKETTARYIFNNRSDIYGNVFRESIDNTPVDRMLSFQSESRFIFLIYRENTILRF